MINVGSKFNQNEATIFIDEGQDHSSYAVDGEEASERENTTVAGYGQIYPRANWLTASSSRMVSIFHFKPVFKKPIA